MAYIGKIDLAKVAPNHPLAHTQIVFGTSLERLRAMVKVAGPDDPFYSGGLVMSNIHQRTPQSSGTPADDSRAD